MAGYPKYGASPATLAQLLSTQAQIVSMVAEAQVVVAYRMLGMFGAWNVTPSESGRMVSEKHDAFTQSGNAAFAAAMAGKRPDQILASATRPLRLKTRANAKRLSKRGPRQPFS